MFMTNKRGRPKKGNSKTREFKLHLDENENERLQYIAYKADISKSEALRKALGILYDLEKTRD